MSTRAPSILFVVPQSRNLDGTPRSVGWPYVGVAYLAAYLRPRGFKVATVDLALSHDHQAAISEAARASAPDLVGLTVFTPLAHDARAIVRTIRAACPGTPLVVGGPHISTTREEFLAETGAEYGIMRDGEQPLATLLDTVTQGVDEEKLAGIPGLIFRRKDGTYSIRENNAMIEDLDEIPFPDWTVFDLPRYPAWVDRASYAIITSRGCPYQCTYCAAPHVTGRRFRKRSAENVIAEIGQYYEAGFHRFGVADDAFNIDIERAKKICRLIIANGYRITWDMGNGIRANVMDEELAQLLARSGCNFVGLGMESGNDGILKKIRKGLTVREMREALELLGRVGIGTAVNFIIGHPDDTCETAMDTIREASRINASYSNIYNMIPLKGTEAYEQLRDMERRGEARFLYDYDHYISNIYPVDVEPVYETPAFTREQRRRVLRMGRNITKRAALQYRFGKAAGGILYLLVRNQRAFHFAMRVVDTRFGNRLYLRLRRE